MTAPSSPSIMPIHLMMRHGGMPTTRLPALSMHAAVSSTMATNAPTLLARADEVIE
jgi:hypothetical protein